MAEKDQGRFLGHEILHSRILEETRRGAVVDIEYWIKGHHPYMGKHLWGLTGPETYIRFPIIKPLSMPIIIVREPEKQTE